MKRSLFVLAAAGAGFLAGCVVTSVSPFYTQKDLVSEPALLGNWINEKSVPEVWRFEQSGDKACRFTLIEARKATVMDAHAFRLGGQLFLDIASIEEDIHVIPPHYILKVSQLGESTLQMSELNEDWLREILAKNPTFVRHHLIANVDHPEQTRVVLTGDTAELQDFVLKHLKTQDAWKESFELKRERSAKTFVRASNN